MPIVVNVLHLQFCDVRMFLHSNLKVLMNLTCSLLQIRADSTQDIAHPLDHDRFSLDLFRHRQSSEFVGESSVSPNKSFNLGKFNVPSQFLCL